MCALLPIGDTSTQKRWSVWDLSFHAVAILICAYESHDINLVLCRICMCDCTPHQSPAIPATRVGAYKWSNTPAVYNMQVGEEVLRHALPLLFNKHSHEVLQP
jgi:hypothetical protein